MITRKLHIPIYVSVSHAECIKSLLNHLGILYTPIKRRETGDYYLLSIPSDEILKILESLDYNDYLVLIEDSDEVS